MGVHGPHCSTSSALGILRMKLSLQLPLSAQHQLTQPYGTTHGYDLALATSPLLWTNQRKLLVNWESSVMMILHKMLYVYTRNGKNIKAATVSEQEPIYYTVSNSGHKQMLREKSAQTYILILIQTYS